MIDVLRLLGPPAVPAAARFLLDESMAEAARTVVAESLAGIAGDHPECRQPCIDAIVSALERFGQSAPSVNSIFVAMLLKLRARETAPLLRSVFRSQRIDKFL